MTTEFLLIVIIKYGIMKSVLFTLFLVFFTSVCCYSQENNSSETKYRRSSLYTVLLFDDYTSQEQREIIKSAYEKYGLPDKYNEHNLPLRIFDLHGVLDTKQDRKDAISEGAKKLNSLGGALTGMAFGRSNYKQYIQNMVQGVENYDIENWPEATMAAKVKAYCRDNFITEDLIKLWWDYSPEMKDGTHFSVDTIIERGIYNASQLDKIKAQKVIGGMNKIVSNASLDLIPNTFILVTRISFVSPDDMSKKVTGILNGLSQTQHFNQNDLGSGIGLYGYWAKSTSYLFQLKWNKEIEEHFISQNWNSNDLEDLYSSSIYGIKFVGKTTDRAKPALKLNIHATDEQKRDLLEKTTMRAYYGAIAKLQKKYDVFKTKDQVFVDGDKIYSYIGKKEGVESGDKFEVLEQNLKDDGTVVYQRVATLKAMEGKIWDNRIGATEADNPEGLNATYFEGDTLKIFPGSLIRQIK